MGLNFLGGRREAGDAREERGGRRGERGERREERGERREERAELMIYGCTLFTHTLSAFLFFPLAFSPLPFGEFGFFLVVYLIYGV